MLRQLLLLFLLLNNCSAQQQQNAVLVIGGYWAQNPVGATVMNSVELYGCAGGEGTSIDLANLPRPGYLTGGTWRADQDDVLVCGGYHCDGGGTSCAIEAACVTWNPRSKVWDASDVPGMHAIRESHLMAHGPNLNSGNSDDNVIAIGYTRTTEIYDWATNAWSNYRDLPESAWSTESCLFQDHDDQEYIYHVGNNITRIDVRDWSVTILAAVPPTLAHPGRCSPVTIGGNRGIFSHFGFFYDLTAQDWFGKAPPPHYATASLPNSLWHFQGRPTFFGNRKCDNHNVCVDTEVLQYDPDTDTWITLVDMNHSRTYHDVIEVPGVWCDHFVSPPTTTPATTTAGGTRLMSFSYLVAMGITIVRLLSSS